MHTFRGLFLIISERGFEDHEYLVEPLSVWTRHSENKVYFVSRPQKYVMFRDPQVSMSEHALSSRQSLIPQLNTGILSSLLFSPSSYFTCGKRKSEHL